MGGDTIRLGSESVRCLAAHILAYLAASAAAGFAASIAMGEAEFLVWGILLTLVCALVPTIVIVWMLRAQRMHPLCYGPAGVLAAYAATKLFDLATDSTFLLPIGIGGLVGGFTYIAVFKTFTEEIPRREIDTQI